ncbi:MAG: hypothetical protein ABIO70_21435 [Pseudomonadota bacterium]
MRPALLALTLLSGCSTLGTLSGARPLDPGQHALQAAISLQHASEPLSLATGLPLPQIELGYRHGLAPDLDWGARVYLFGTVADLRYRFARLGRFDLATQPSLGLCILPIPAMGIGNVDLGLPLIAETDLGPHTSLVLAARTVTREHFAWEVGTGSTGRFELLAGGGVRVSRRFERVSLGGYGDVLVNTSRLGPLWWTGGVDLGIRLGRLEVEPDAPGPG